MDWKLDLDNAFSDLFARRRLALLGLFWLIAIAAVLSYRAISPDALGVARSAPIVLPLLDENETGPFASWRDGVLIESQSSCKVEFDNLRAENGRLGLFRTASNKTACIDNLRVTCRQPSARESGVGVRLGDFCDLFAPRREEISKTSRIGVLSDPHDPMQHYSIGIDLTNTTMVQIRNMVWQVRRGDRAVMEIQCRRACLQGETPYVLLQGHAIVRTPTATLEGNCIKMNVRDNCFVVDGHYLLTQHGRRRSGVGGCFDTELKPYQVASMDGSKQDEWMHALPLGYF